MKIKNKKILLRVSIGLLLLYFLVVVIVANRPLPGSGLPPATVENDSITAGIEVSMAITEDGSLWSWGSNSCGQLGDGTMTNQQYPISIMEDVVAVSSSNGGISFPRPGRATVFTESNSHTLAITSDGTLWGWGVDLRTHPYSTIRNLHQPVRLIEGIIGSEIGSDSFVRNVSEPEKIMYNVVSASAGGAHAMAITSDGTLWGWGENTAGQVGEGSNSYRTSPVEILDDVIAVSAGGRHTLAITSDGTLWGWGQNGVGQLGDGTNENRNSPVEIIDNVIAVSASGSKTVAITSDGTLWSWGYLSNTPVEIMDDVVSVSTSDSITLAITSDGALWGWGRRNRYGQIGDGTTETRHYPVRIMDDVVSVSATGRNTLAVTSDGTLWAWGDNSSGQLGDGTTTNRLYPVRIMEDVHFP